MEAVTLKDHGATGYCIPLENCNLVFVVKGNSLLACGAFDVVALDKFNVPAAKITGVSTVDDLLAGEVKQVNDAARACGVMPGDTGTAALAKM